MTTTDGPAEVEATHRTVLPGVAMIAITFGLARYGYGLLLPDMQRDLGLAPSAAGLISSGGYAAYLAANLGVVPLTTRRGARAAVLAAAASAAAGMAVVAVATGPVVLALGVALAGAASGFAFPPYAEVVARRVEAPRRDAAWSAISSGTGWGVALAGPVAILAGEQWRLAWAVFVAVAVAVGAWAWWWAPTGRSGPVRRPQLSPSWFLCPRSGPLLVSSVLVGLGSAVFWSFSVEALGRAGLDPTTARALYAVGGAAMLLGSFSGVVFARLGLRRGYLAACLLLAASLGGFAVGRDAVVPAVLAVVGFAAAYAAVIAAHGVWSARVFAEHPAAGLAAVSTALTLGTLLGPTLAGLVVAPLGYGVVFALAGATVLAAVPFCPPTAARAAVLERHVCRAAPVRDEP
ncbi:hypothetical protein GCM10023340_05620 [Nocardioides marinquilinus]|uniref:Major facilitator superfamily (MFS) profile domain-containing protein n=1 Tax=Nocardioides marinquilinus TaxID=1210400 RepID=A0ABP9P843_9ACTN